MFTAADLQLTGGMNAAASGVFVLRNRIVQLVHGDAGFHPSVDEIPHDPDQEYFTYHAHVHVLLGGAMFGDACQGPPTYLHPSPPWPFLQVLFGGLEILRELLNRHPGLTTLGLHRDIIVERSRSKPSATKPKARCGNSGGFTAGKTDRSRTNKGPVLGVRKWGRLWVNG